MKTKNILFFFFAMLFIQNISAQTKSTLTGKITDEKTGLPLPNASIRIHDVNRDAIANEKGDYKTSFISPGNYLVEVSHVGYGSIVETITISGSTIKNFSLKDAVVEQEGITITGVSTATRLRQSPQPVIVLKKSELFKISSSNIINSLTHVPGVNALTTGPAISKPFIRGLGYNRVLVINDGVKQEGQQWGDEHGIEIDDYSVQRIEVLKGPASLMYGSDGLAGVINIQSLAPVSEGTIMANLLGEYQTNSRLRGYYGNVAGAKNGFSFNAYGSYKGAQDYKNKKDGYVFNSKFNNKNAGAMLGHNGSYGHSYLRVSNFDQHTGIIEGDRDSVSGKFLKGVAGGGEAALREDGAVLPPRALAVEGEVPHRPDRVPGEQPAADGDDHQHPRACAADQGHQAVGSERSDGGLYADLLRHHRHGDRRAAAEPAAASQAPVAEDPHRVAEPHRARERERGAVHPRRGPLFVG